MTWTLQLDRVQFADDLPGAFREPDVGCAFYLLLVPCLEDIRPCQGRGAGRPCSIVCASHPGLHHYYEGQHFAPGPVRTYRDATPEEIQNDQANVWSWDGNREAPTLSPSFLAVEVDKQGRRIRPYRAHWFLTGGRIQLCGDSTVSLHPSPVPCLPR